MGKKLVINFTNKWLYTFALFIGIFALAVSVYAYNSGGPPSSVGHSAEELEGVCLSDGTNCLGGGGGGLWTDAGMFIYVDEDAVVGGTTSPNSADLTLHGTIADFDIIGDIGDGFPAGMINIYRNAEQKGRIWADGVAGDSNLHLSSGDDTADLTVDDSGNVVIRDTLGASGKLLLYGGFSSPYSIVFVASKVGADCANTCSQAGGALCTIGVDASGNTHSCTSTSSGQCLCYRV
jgi:hypothetical protein